MILLWLFLFCLGAWIAWVVAAGLEIAARGEKGGVSIFPAIPCFPVIACLVAFGIDYLKEDAGTMIIFSMHALLFLAWIFSIIRSSIKLRRMRQEEKRE